MYRNLFAALAAVALSLGSVGLAHAQTCATPPVTPCSAHAGCQGRITVDGWKVKYWRNYALGARNTAVTRAVVVIHGLGRNASGAFNNIVDAAQAAEADGVDGCATRNTIILAPKFQSKGNSSGNDSPAWDELYWDRAGWTQGDQAAAPWPYISSYDVVDDILARLNSSWRFPNLREIIVVGHSAGGQFTNRYAAGSRQAGQLRSNIDVRFVVTNPSSYLYLSPKRPVPGTTSFASPVYWVGGTPIPNTSFLTVGYCPYDYNDYKYGLDALNPYMASAGVVFILTNYPWRDVTYFLGEDDDFDNGNMATGCAAMLQGPNRLERGLAYFDHIDGSFPGYHDLVTVPGVAHSEGGMYESDEGVDLLFGG